MLRPLAVLTTILLLPGAAAGQAGSTLHIRMVLVDRERRATPVARHVLLISDNPTTAPPRRVVTSAGGTADVRLPPGNYTVESDQPVRFLGRAYQWTQLVDVAEDRDTVLELTADNADADGGDAAPGGGQPTGSDAAFLLPQWQNSIVALWTATAHASGFLIDSNGLIATNHRSIGSSTTVEVQLTPELKVPGAVLVSDARRDVAVLRINPAVVASIRPLPACAPDGPPVTDGTAIHAIQAPLGQDKSTTAGAARHGDAHAIASDLLLGVGAAGGPVFTEDGRLIGLTDEVDDGSGRRRGDARIIRIGDVCSVVALAQQKMKGAAAPKDTHLPVEPAAQVPAAALEEIVNRRVGNLKPYTMETADFEIAFLTPVTMYGVRHPPEPQRRGGREGGLRVLDAASAGAHVLSDFSNWFEYVEGLPPVLMIRVTPKQVEGFWTKVARGAAVTQGMGLPPITHVKAGFRQLRAYCGDAERIPIHPFKLEQRISDTDTIYEGLYVFDPNALTPSCGSVKLVLYSEKAPARGDARVVDANAIQRLWQDFAPYRQ